MAFVGALCVLAAVVSVVSPTPTPSAPPEIVHVVTSDRAETTLQNTIRTTYVVTAQEIARRGYRTIGDALADVPGVEISRYGTIGSAVSYGIRGSSSAQVLVLINGEPATGSFANSVNFGTISTLSVRRIEVVEGGGSTLYGTGAIGGIINIITDAQDVEPSATLRYGTFNDRELRVQAKGLSIERTVATNTYALPASIDTFSGAPNPTTRNDSDIEATTARLGLDRKAGAVDAALRATVQSDQLGSIGFFPGFSPTSREADVNDDASLAFTLRRAQSAPVLQLFGSSQRITFSCDAASDPNCFFSVPALNTEARSGLGIRNVVHGSNERLIYGIDLSRGVVRSDDGNGNITANAIAQSAAYVQQNLEMRSGEVYGGLRAERDGSLGGEFSPSLGWRKDLGDGVTFKLNAASAFRAPNTSELYFPGYGFAGLRAERAGVGDLSLTDQHLLGGVSLTWFTNRTNDLIVPEQIGTDTNGFPIFGPRNVDHAFIQGFTLDAKTLALHGVTATLGITDLYRAEDLDLQARLPHDPVLSVNMQLALHGSPSSVFDEAGIALQSVGARAAVDYTQPLFYQAGAYSTIDAYTRFRVTPRLLLALRGYNIGNERYAQVAGYPMPGRTFAVELTTK